MTVVGPITVQFVVTHSGIMIGVGVDSVEHPNVPTIADATTPTVLPQRYFFSLFLGGYERKINYSVVTLSLTCYICVLNIFDLQWSEYI